MRPFAVRGSALPEPTCLVRSRVADRPHLRGVAPAQQRCVTRRRRRPGTRQRSISSSSTPEPSPLPSPLPTEWSACTTTEDGRFDPSPYLALAKPEITTYSGFALPLESERGIVSNTSSFTRRFGLLSGAAPGSSFAFQATLGANLVGAAGGAPGTTREEPATRIDVMLKTPRVYHDKTTVQLSYQLHDSVGRTRVMTDGLSVSLHLSLLGETEDDATATITVACGSPGSVSGIGTCTTAAAAAWFVPESSSSGLVRFREQQRF